MSTPYSHAELRTTDNAKRLVPEDEQRGCMPEKFRLQYVGMRFTQVRRNLTQMAIRKCTRQKHPKKASMDMEGEDKATLMKHKLQSKASTRMKVDVIYGLKHGEKAAPLSQEMGAIEEGRESADPTAHAPSKQSHAPGSAIAGGPASLLEEQPPAAIVVKNPDGRPDSSILGKGDLLKSEILAAMNSKKDSLISNVQQKYKKSGKDLLKESALYVQVLSAKDLSPAKLTGDSDPYVLVMGGTEEYRTSHVNSTLMPNWTSEQFSFKGSDVVAADSLIAFEVWSYDDFHPDDFLGQAEIDLNKLNLREDDIFSLKLDLYVLKANGKKESGKFGELFVRLWINRSATSGLQPSLCTLKGQMAAGPSDVTCKLKMLPSITRNALGTVYEEPCVVFVRLSIDSVLGLYEHRSGGGTIEVGANTWLSGDCPIAARAVCKTRSMVVDQLKKRLASTRKVDSMSLGDSLERSSAISSRGFVGTRSSTGFGKFGRVGASSERRALTRPSLSGIRRQLFRRSKEEAVAAFDGMSPIDEDEAFFQLDSSRGGVADFNHIRGTSSGGTGTRRTESGSGEGSMGADRTSPSSSKDAGGASNAATTGRPHSRKGYLYLEVEYAHQTYTSKMVRLDLATGTAHIRQDFVFATVRPIRSRPVMVGVYVTLNKKKTGRLVGQFTEDIVDLVRVCEKADANAREHGIPPDTPALRKPTCGPEYQLPLMSWPLDQGYHGVLQMHVGAADWDYRAQMYNIPLLEEPPLSRGKADAKDDAVSGKSSGGRQRDDAATASAPGKPSLAALYAAPGTDKNFLRRSTPAPPALDMDGKPRNEVERWVQDARANTLDSTLDAAALEAAQTASRTVAALRDQGAAGSSGTHGGAPPGAPQLINTSGGLRGVLESLQVLALALLLRLFSSMCTGSCSVRDGMLAWLHERLREVKVGDTELLPNFQSESQREAIKYDLTMPVPARSEAASGRSPRQSTSGGVQAAAGNDSFKEGTLSARDPEGAARTLSGPLSTASGGTGLAPKLPVAAGPAGARTFHHKLSNFVRDTISISEQRSVKERGDAKSDGHAAVAPAKPPLTIRPVGTLTLKVDRVKVSLPGVWYFIIFKLGPEWIRTPLRSSDAATPMEWKMRMPVFDPSETMTTMTFYQRTPNAKPNEVFPYSRCQVHISNLTPNVTIERHISVDRIPPKGKEEEMKRRKEKERRKKEEAKANMRNAMHNVGVSPGTRLLPKDMVEHHGVEVNFSLRLEYRSWMEVAEAYVRPRHPDSYYIMSLDNASQEVLERQHAQIVARWLQNTYPPVHHSWVREMLRNRRQEFSFAQIKENFARVKLGLNAVQFGIDAFDRICSWRSPLHSATAWALVALLGFYPSLAVPTLLLWVLKVIHSRRRLAGMPPSVHRLVPDGSDEDDDLDAPTAEGAIARLKRQYEQAVQIALLAQNYFDDIAVVFERVHSLMSWADPAATIMFSVVVFAISVLIYLLGWPLLFSAALMFLMRPPFMRDPMPAKPIAMFQRLPAAIGSHYDTFVNRLASGEPCSAPRRNGKSSGRSGTSRTST
mmetsp:Transcript_40785/g.121729  ORF Transcript_40785/g.121729 Transcript_40785/m.121729 type:complete len:1546 (-) Transcript_40785:1222-5859(-)